MKKKNEKKTETIQYQNGTEGEAPRNINRLPVVIHGQYIKDFSLENPNAPQAMRANAGWPTMEIGFTMDARKIEDAEDANLFEVTLGVEAITKRVDEHGKEMIAFIVDLQYGVLLSLNEVSEEQTHPLLLIEMPRYAFPFVRQIIADATQQAGFVPLLLQPVDFREFYLQRYGGQKPETGQSAA